MKINIPIIIIAAALFLSCQDKKQNLIPECGAVKTLVVNKEFTEKYQLNDFEFTLDYYDGMEVEMPEAGEKNYEFIGMEKLDENGAMQESFKMGSFEMTGGEDEGLSDRYLSILNMMKDGFTYDYQLENIESGIKNVNGKDYHIYDAVGIKKSDVEGATSSQEPVKHLLRMAIVPSQLNPREGLTVTMIATPDSMIKTQADFDQNGCISLSFNTLKLK
jgi:hypothetical protein